ncbi:RAMP superfamily CRISPR-associated protein [Frankia sp. CiP1_Cm_nod2]
MVRRLRVHGWLRLETPLHVGGVGDDPSVDLALAVDGLSRLYVPGTSLAGALRAFAGRSIADRLVLDDIWGNVPQNTTRANGSRQSSGNGSSGSDDGSTSRIVVHDGLVTTGTDLGSPFPPSRVEARTGIGIDRVLGTVAEGFLYGRAVLPRGAYLRLGIDLESPYRERDADPATAMLGTLLLALAGGRVRLGAARTRGLGSVVLAGEPEIVEQRFDSMDGLLGALGLLPATPTASGSGPPAVTSAAAAAPAGAPAALTPTDLGGRDPDADLLRVTIVWRPTSPVMVRSAVDGLSIDALPLVSGIGCDEVALVLPGSSIKGALRSHAERIERTARARDAAHPLDVPAGPQRSARFREQLDDLAAVNALFGSAGTAVGGDGYGDGSEDSSGDAGGDGRGTRATRGVGALGADDCYSEQAIPADLWRALNGAHVTGLSKPSDSGPTRSWDKARAQVPPKVRERLRELGMDQADHVAIDRWTGGAADKRLYSTLEPHHVTWQDLLLTVDLRRLNRFDTAPAGSGDPAGSGNQAGTAGESAGSGTKRGNDAGSGGQGNGGGLARPALALLLLVLRDLRAGRLRLGHGVNRGHGDIIVESVRISGFPGLSDAERDFDDLLREPAVAAYTRSWQDYLDRDHLDRDRLDQERPDKDRADGRPL